MGEPSDFDALDALFSQNPGNADVLRLVVDAVPMAIVVIDAAGMMVSANPQAEQLFGYAREDLIGRSVATLVPKRFRDGDPGQREAFLRALTGSPMGGDLYGLRRDGSEFPVEVGLTNLETSEGRFVLAAVIDVTSRRRTERTRILNAGIQLRNEQLTALNVELESFSSSVSHDLQAPLRAIAGYAQALAEDYGVSLDAEGNRLLAVVRDEAARMTKLIDDLLEFSRLGLGVVDRDAVDMNALARDVVRNLNDDGATAFEVGDLPQAAGDASLIRLIWENLISNAIKYSGKQTSPEVHISGALVDGEAVFEVADNGVGFDVRYAEKLFGVFVRLHNADEFPGTGVGLATVNRVVLRHHGRVWGTGEVGCGAHFHFALPAVER